MYNSKTFKWIQNSEISNSTKDTSDKIKNKPASSSNLSPQKFARALATSLKHNHLAVGTGSGKIQIRDLNDINKKLHKLTEPTEYSEVMKYSPC